MCIQVASRSTGRHLDIGHDLSIDTRIAKLGEFASETSARLGKIASRLEQTATKADLSALQVAMQKGPTAQPIASPQSKM
jgi:hypothetical protein